MKAAGKNRVKTFFLYTLVCLFFHSASSYPQQVIDKPNWDMFNYLVGEWVGGGSGDPGQGAGTFSFTLDLDERILTRKSHTEYPASNGRPAFSHDDLMIIYFENDKPKAIYFDNEGHTINYNVLSNVDTIVLVSDASTSSPRFRLSYIKTSNDSISIVFEIAMPASPEKFSKYLEGNAHRKNL
jgi:hypothetical protein